jgi:hypothetical protein
MLNVPAAEQRSNQQPGRLLVLTIEILRVTPLQIAHEVGDRVGRRCFEDPVGMVVEQAVAMNRDIVHFGILAYERESVLEVFGIPIDPLAAIAALGDGVELLRMIIARLAHGG